MKALDITHNIIEKRGNYICIDMISRKNTWSNQRRKRRLLKRMEAETYKKSKTDDVQDKIGNGVSMNSSSKEGGVDINLSSSSTSSYETTTVDEQNKDSSQKINDSKTVLHALVKVLKREKNIFIEMEFLDGCAGKQGLHEVIQYIKNNWK